MSKKISIDVNDNCRCCVLYASKTGFTEKYAEYIASRLGCRAVKAERLVPSADLYIVGGGIYQGNMLAKKTVETLLANGKKVIAFAVGLMRPQEGKGEKVASKNFPGVKCFYFRGGYAPEKLSFIERAGMKMMYRIYKKKDNPDLRETADAIAAGGADFSDLSDADGLINYVATLSENLGNEEVN